MRAIVCFNTTLRNQIVGDVGVLFVTDNGIFMPFFSCKQDHYTPAIPICVKEASAVASGPLITTINDLIAVTTYYGLAWLILLNFMHLA